MPKAIDLHVHLPTEQWLQQSIGPHLEATEAYFRARVPRKSIEDVAQEYADRDVLGVVLDWDDESVTGRGWMGNDWLAGLADRFPGVLMGFGSVDPHAEDAVDEVKRCADLDRWFREFDELGLPEGAAGPILKGNAARLLGLN